MPIRFEGEEEQAQTDALAGRMIEQAALGHFFMRKEIRRFVNSNLGTNDSYAYIEFIDGSWIKFSGMFRIESSNKGFEEILKTENYYQAGSVTPDPARTIGDAIMRGVDPPTLDKAGDPQEQFESPTAYPIDPPKIDGPNITKET